MGYAGFEMLRLEAYGARYQPAASAANRFIPVYGLGLAFAHRDLSLKNDLATFVLIRPGREGYIVVLAIWMLKNRLPLTKLTGIGFNGFNILPVDSKWTSVDCFHSYSFPTLSPVTSP